jgi:hypothetical protein
MREGGSTNKEDDPEQTMKRMMGFRGGQGSFESYFQGLEKEEDQSEGMGAFMQAYRLTGESKVEGVCDFIETLVDAGAKFLVFAHH